MLLFLLMLASLLALVTAVLWRQLRRSQGLRRSWANDGSAIAALNRAQRQRRPAAPALAPAPLALPRTALEERLWLRQLKLLSQGSLADRLEAMERCGRWGDRRCLPLLRRGLRDAHGAVVEQAALGLERFRGEPQGGWPGAAQAGKAALPRNVARMR
jgi:HEAT repeat protein